MSVEDLSPLEQGFCGLQSNQSAAQQTLWLLTGREMAASAELYTWDSENPKSTGSKKSPFDAVGVQVDIGDVCYSVFLNGEEKKLLQHVSFHLEPGDMCALMGASGAGKRLVSSFLHCSLLQ